jgi:hypothetical protein
MQHCAEYGPSKYLHHPTSKRSLSLHLGPKKHNTWKEENTMRTVMTVRNKEIRALQAAKLCEVPTSTCENKINSEEHNV